MAGTPRTLIWRSFGETPMWSQASRVLLSSGHPQGLYI